MKAQRETANLLNTKKAAAFLGLSLSSFYTYCTRKGLQPTKVRRSRRWYSKESLEAWRAGHPSPTPRQERTLTAGYITTSDLWQEMQRLTARGERRPLSRQKIIDVLNAAGAPRLEVKNAAGPGTGYAWEQEAALRALLSTEVRPYSPPEKNHLLATPAILHSKKWVTCRRAAEIIGCSAAEVSSRAVKYSVKSYLHPQTRKLLVNWLEVKEAMAWRKPHFIRRYLGTAGLALVRRTCPVRNYFDSAGVRCGISYRVPELITVQGTRTF
ncbi:MAG: helix-turn-helix domain-containing protein [Akkermansia sp.]|nr:helix-turn-helix domain-containing protein [Akkermansia sp.]